MKPFVSIALAAVCLVAAGPPNQQATRDNEQAPNEAREKQNLERWQGAFELVSMIADGKATPREELKKRKLSIEGNKYHFQSGDFSEHGSYRWDLTKDPRHVDIIVGDGADKGKVYLAAFVADDEEIQLCFAKDNKKRPQTLVGSAGSGQVLEVWKKVKP